jgi:hypothetical protein
MDFRDAASAERADILREGGQGRSGGAAGKKREAAGRPKAEPTFPESGKTCAFGQGNCERPPGELARRETAPASKGSPGEKRTVGKPGSPGGKEPQRTIAGLPEGCSRMVAGLPERRPNRRKRGLPRESLKGWRGACSGLSRIEPQRSLLFWNSIGNRPGSRDPGRNLRRGRWQHRPRFAFGDILRAAAPPAMRALFKAESVSRSGAPAQAGALRAPRRFRPSVGPRPEHAPANAPAFRALLRILRLLFSARSSRGRPDA